MSEEKKNEPTETGPSVLEIRKGLRTAMKNLLGKLETASSSKDRMELVADLCGLATAHESMAPVVALPSYDPTMGAVPVLD